MISVAFIFISVLPAVVSKRVIEATAQMHMQSADAAAKVAGESVMDESIKSFFRGLQLPEGTDPEEVSQFLKKIQEMGGLYPKLAQRLRTDKEVVKSEAVREALGATLEDNSAKTPERVIEKIAKHMKIKKEHITLVKTLGTGSIATVVLAEIQDAEDSNKRTQHVMKLTFTRDLETFKDHFGNFEHTQTLVNNKLTRSFAGLKNDEMASFKIFLAAVLAKKEDIMGEFDMQAEFDLTTAAADLVEKCHNILKPAYHAAPDFNIRVPKVKLHGKRLLEQEMATGSSMAQIKKNTAQNQKIGMELDAMTDEAKGMSKAYKQGFVPIMGCMLMHGGMTHADAHGGNLIYDHGSKTLWAIDWGAVVEFPNPAQREQLTMLVKNLARAELSAIRTPCRKGESAEQRVSNFCGPCCKKVSEMPIFSTMSIKEKRKLVTQVCEQGNLTDLAAADPRGYLYDCAKCVPDKKWCSVPLDPSKSKCAKSCDKGADTISDADHCPVAAGTIVWKGVSMDVWQYFFNPANHLMPENVDMDQMKKNVGDRQLVLLMEAVHMASKLILETHEMECALDVDPDCDMKSISLLTQWSSVASLPLFSMVTQPLQAKSAATAEQDSRGVMTKLTGSELAEIHGLNPCILTEFSAQFLYNVFATDLYDPAVRYLDTERTIMMQYAIDDALPSSTDCEFEYENSNVLMTPVLNPYLRGDGGGRLSRDILQLTTRSHMNAYQLAARAGEQLTKDSPIDEIKSRTHILAVFLLQYQQIPKEHRTHLVGKSVSKGLRTTFGVYWLVFSEEAGDDCVARLIGDKNEKAILTERRKKKLRETRDTTALQDDGEEFEFS
eukprot:gnl/MRDRNA2_/MRDRNA2_63126_c0_seq1.p1 gnl/MRDRNA2_/MRDRNA2_63126_c0~~gnl/MRDRNA2_/MRDRNA2_63126_c0_seq1.p1  ORF type:complete len:834 (+),score=161.57 gnl/MRDRNA2_/MRDRNA2_63126_c0_seq1:102-2603(+)